MARNALGLEFGNVARLSKMPGSVLNCLWDMHLKDLLGSIVRVGYRIPVPDFYLVPSLPKKHYNGLNQTNLVTVYRRIYGR